MKQFLKASCVLLCLILVFVILAFHSTKLKTEGHYNLVGLTAPVKVHFDEFGIPHIKGKSSEDVQRVLGYIMASERLFQMELMRRVINGELSVVLGEKFVDVDILSRTLRLKKTAQEFLSNKPQALPTHVINDMQAYIDGIHQYIKQGPLPIDFRIAGFSPGKFELADLLAVSSYMALGFSEGLAADVLFSELMEELPEEKLDILRVGEKSDRNYFKLEKQKKKLDIEKLDEGDELELIDEIQSTFLKIKKLIPLFHGSNAWVLSGSRTTSGAPLLANDPHIATSNPHVFYEAHISHPKLETYGHYLPLNPFPVMGHTPDMAWGLTMAEVDDVTLYLEKVNPEKPNQVMYKNEWVDMVVENETLKIKGQKDRQFQVRRTPHGPIITGTSKGVSGKILSLHWSVYHKQNNSMRTLYEIPYATTVDKLRSALAHAGAPGLNVMYANKLGDIAWWTMGKFPKLPEGVPYDLVLNGWDGTQEVERYYSIDENPHSINPSEGAIVSANYRPIQQQYSHFDGYWQPGERFFRISRMLASQEKWNVSDVMKLQTDLHMEGYDKHIKSMSSSLKDISLESTEVLALELFENWDGNTDLNNIGASLFFTWMSFIEKNLFLDEFGEDNFKRFSKSTDFWHAMKELLTKKDHSFWDDIKTDRVESGDEILVKSYHETIEFLSQKFGDNVHKWTWGRLHKSWYKHPIGRVWPLNLIYDIGPIPASGSRFVINNLGHKRLSHDFTVTSAPAVRRIIDFSNIESSYGVLSTGNSGNPFSPFFADQVAIYNDGQYRSQLMDWKQIEKLPELVFTSP